MARGKTDLSSYGYDAWLSTRAKTSRSAMQELAQRTKDRRRAHDSEGKGYHFGLGDEVVKVESREHFKSELDKRGLMLEIDVKKDLRKPERRKAQI